MNCAFLHVCKCKKINNSLNFYDICTLNLNSMSQETKIRRRLLHKLRNKYKLVILNDETYEEKISLRLSRMNVFIVSGTITILLIALTTILIAFTPLREYIPGYTDVALSQKIYRLQNLTDSLDLVVQQRGRYLENIQNILEGRDTVVTYASITTDSLKEYVKIVIRPSREDSLLRLEYQGQLSYKSESSSQDSRAGTRNLSSFAFFTPLRGIVTGTFDPKQKHYGIDIVSVQREAVKATLDGMVIFTGWTLETGYTMVIQHHNDLLSVYQHNSTLLKDKGSYVKAGDPIAVVGSTGKLSTGPHLHLEIWYQGVAINPADFIAF
jgi:murein DD-endopeptidase MepM/ murein hydrolase activator NlpD